MFETNEEIQERWTSDVTLIMETAEKFAVERGFCDAWRRDVLVQLNQKLEVPLPVRTFKIERVLEANEWHYNLDHIRERWSVTGPVTITTAPVILPSFSPENNLRAWARQISTISNHFSSEAARHGYLIGYSRHVEAINDRLHFKLLDGPIEYVIEYAANIPAEGRVTFTFAGDPEADNEAFGDAATEAILEDIRHGNWEESDKTAEPTDWTLVER